MLKIVEGFLEAECEDLESDSGKGLSTAVRFEVFITRAVDRVYFGQFILAPCPGCCGIVFSINSVISPLYRGTHSKNFHRLKEVVAKYLGYSCMLATTQLTNIPELVGASKNEWRIVGTFRNSRTTNDIAIMMKKTRPSPL